MTIKVAGKDVEGSPFRAVIAPGYHARVVEGVKPFKIVDIHNFPKVIFPSGQPCLEGKMTVGGPFEDSGVGRPLCSEAAEGS